MLSRSEGQEALEVANEIVENRGTIPIPKKTVLSRKRCLSTRNGCRQAAQDVLFIDAS